MASPNSVPTSPAEVTGTTGEQVEAEETWLALAVSFLQKVSFLLPTFPAFRMQTPYSRVLPSFPSSHSTYPVAPS